MPEQCTCRIVGNLQMSSGCEMHGEGEYEDVRASFTFHTPGKPVPKMRARVTSGHSYTPAPTVIWEALVRVSALARVPEGWPMDARYRVTLRVTCGDRRRSDVDNHAKSSGMDALNGVAWHDDSQVDELHVYRTVDKACPGVRCTVEILEPSE